MKKYKQWLINAPIKKKFLPTQLVAFSLIAIIACVSLSSLSTVNYLSQKIFTENVKNTEMLTEITETMYKCRVLGRDILLEPDALSSVTPIVNEFFCSIDQFLTHEKDLMSHVLNKNDSTVTFVFIAEIM